MWRLESRVRGYLWGSREVIARVQGRPVPSDGPEAELWIGAHPGDPSTLDSGQGLDAFIAGSPQVLGDSARAEFGDRLPFLMKLLAAAEPLSLQAHPDSAQAAAGFAREEAQGVPLTSPSRSYVDPYHKPEILVAVTDFEALCGFRAPAESAARLRSLGVPRLAPVIEALEAGELYRAVELILGWPADTKDDLVAEVVAADGLAGELAGYHKNDLGVVFALLLNRVTLRPGEAVWMPAGNPHAYLRGAGVEVMAASDNVLRGGLTPKHVNLAELMSVLRFEKLEQPVCARVELAPGVVTWPVPVSDFRLHRVTGPATLDLTGPRLVFCLAGSVVVTDGTGSLTLKGGESLFSAADAGPLSFAGDAQTFVTSL